MLKQPHICRTIMKNTSPVPQSRVFLCATGMNQNQEVWLKNCLLKWSNSSLIHCKNNTWEHVWQEVSPDMLHLICEEKLVNTQRRQTLLLIRKVSNKKRESPLSSTISKCSWCWMEAIRQRFSMLQNPLAFTNSLKTSVKVKLERVFRCNSSPAIIRHWEIAPTTTTLSCEAASRSRCVLLGIGLFSKEWL